MRLVYKHIICFLIALLGFQVNAQIYVGDGLKVSNGTTIYVSGSIIVAEDSDFNGEGILSLNNDNTAKTMASKHINDSPTKNIIKKSSKTSLKTKKEKLPVVYINIASKSFEQKEEQKNSEYQNHIVFHTNNAKTIFENGADYKVNIFYQLDYIIPKIYSYFFSKRFTEDAELYEFEHLYASLRPPIV